MVRGTSTRRVATGLLVAALAGCQLFVSTSDPQCSSDGNCPARGPDFVNTVCVDQLCVQRGDRCVGHVDPSVEDRSIPLHTRLRFVDVGGSPLKGVEVLVCAALDETCGAPVGPAVLTDAEGYAYLTSWKNFAGTFQVRNPPSADFLKLKIHLLGAATVDSPPTQVIPLNQSVRLITKELFALQLKGARAEADPNAGHIFASATDCDLNPRADTSIAVHTDRAGAPILFYFTDNNLVAQDATATASLGTFGVANVPEGPLDVMTTTANGKRLGRVTVWVNKDTISNFTISPTP